MPFVRTNDDCEIYYEERGQGNTLVFVPGFLGITELWRNQIEEFSKEYRCITLDNRGCGRSDKPLPRVSYGVTQHAADLHTILAKLSIERSVIIGHSMGGNTALLYYLDHPEKVVGIVLASSFAAGEQIIQSGTKTLKDIKNGIKSKQERIKLLAHAGFQGRDMI